MRTILEMVVDFIAFMVVLAIGLGCTWLVLMLAKLVMGVF